MKSKSIGILTKPKFPEVKATVHAVVNWLRDRKIDVILDNTSATLLNERGGLQKTQLAQKADVLLILGGDGTMLNAARLAGERSIPILGVNMGGLGFLTEVRLENLYPSLERVFANEYVLDERLMISSHIHRHARAPVRLTGAQDARRPAEAGLHVGPMRELIRRLSRRSLSASLFPTSEGGDSTRRLCIRL